MELQENSALSDCWLYWFRQNNFYTLYYFQSVKMRCPCPLSGCKRDVEMEHFCHGNIAITYAYEPKQISEEISLITEELQSRTVDISNMEQQGIDGNTDFNFNPVCVICDEIILMKLVFPDKLYKETFR